MLPSGKLGVPTAINEISELTIAYLCLDNLSSGKSENIDHFI